MVTQLREGINLRYQFRAVAGNNVIPPDLITDDTIQRIKRYTEQNNLEYKAATMAMQYETLFIAQLFNPNPIPYLAPKYLYSQMQPYHNSQPGGFPRRMRQSKVMWRGIRSRRRAGFQTNIQTDANAFPVYYIT
ncbi:MAG: hypothetical protein EZS28_050374 [Streblomastix strix]|uniref:Uncharacterized protein n=1 Tax=Streblomastix strix TaxID=222440 RepID=A0A5J4T9A1_9EUKA|nr:MAG: hypothetical protein EZS28_050374 [Streblomastix strix]